MVNTTFFFVVASLCLAAGAPPNFFQQQGRMVKSLSVQDVNGGTTCAVCAALLGLGGQLAQVDNSTVDEALEKFCNFLPDKYNDLCRTGIELLGPEAIKLLEEKETSDMVCHVLGLCKNDTDEFCHLFPLPRETEAAATTSLRIMEARKRFGLHNPESFRNKVIETISIKFCNLFKNLCDAFSDHMPYSDHDKDMFSTMETIRGYSWRGKDCDDQNKNIYPGRQSSDDAKVDTNCNGIFGVDPTTNTTYESQWCEGTRPMGTVVLGDSASAHFHIPPSYLEAATMTKETFKDLPFIVENEFDWPMLSSTTGHANISRWSGSISGPVDSIYLHMRELNRCNHRDYQNIAVNGARASSMAKQIVKTLARHPDDNPVLVILALIGNDVCNGHPGLDHMTKPKDMYSHTMDTLDYLNQVLPSGSSVIIGGLVDGRILFEYLAHRIHPIGALNQDITYTDLYDYMNCLQISPCFGWMNSNATMRNLTYQRVLQLNQALKEVVGNFSSDKLKVNYIDTPLPEMIAEWEKEGHQPWELVEPVDGFHPGQAGQALDAKISFNMFSKMEGILPKPNPFNDKIKEKFGDQGGYGDELI